MSTAQHTPGPWEAVELVDGGGVGIVRIGDIVVEGMYRGGDQDSLPMPDARLIAGAPDLLAACEGLLNRYLVMGCGEGIEARAAMLAIAKATGSEA